jgi:predicted nucleotidyltransferase
MTPNFAELITTRLVDAGVDFIIVGGVCAVLHGSPFVTQDFDVCYRRTPENIRRLVAALKPLDPRARGFPTDLPFVFDERTIQLGSNFTFLIGSEELDLLGTMSAIGGYEDVIARAVEMQVAGHSVKVLALPDLIATKEAAGRQKDLVVLPALRALLEQQLRRDQAQPE